MIKLSYPVADAVIKIAALRPILEYTTKKVKETTGAVLFALVGTFAERDLISCIKKRAESDYTHPDPLVDYDFFVVNDYLDEEKTRFDLATPHTIYPMELLDTLEVIFPYFKRAACHRDARFTQREFHARLADTLNLADCVARGDKHAETLLRSNRDHILDLTLKSRGVMLFIGETISPDVVATLETIRRKVGSRAALGLEEYITQVWLPAARLIKQQYLDGLEEYAKKYPSIKPARDAIFSVAD